MASAADQQTQRVLVIDFGSQVSHLICRRCREVGVYAELKSCLAKVEDIRAFKPTGLILSGGPHSVYEEGSPHLDKAVWAFVDEQKVPVLGVCYGLQEMCHALGGKVEPGAKREFGHAEVRVWHAVPSAASPTKRAKGRSMLFDGIQDNKKDPSVMKVWMSHGDKVTKLPEGFVTVADTDSCEFAAVANSARKMYGVQFHPEVTHTPSGTQLIGNFLKQACGCEGQWSMTDFARVEVERILNKLGSEKHIIGAVSGGVDSSVAAALVHKAVKDRFHPFLVDTGLLRKDEAVEVKERLEKHIPGMKLTVIDESARFYAELAGVTEPEKKRKIIGRLFIEAFQRAVEKMGIDTSQCLLLQGTLYPDVIESTSFRGPSSVIKTHHNVGGLPAQMKMEVIEPLRLLFKDEVRALGKELGLPHQSVMRHPFPGPGLGIRILGEVNAKHAEELRKADAIYIEELMESGHYYKCAQAFTVLLPTVRSVGVMGDHRTYEHVCCLRAVTTSDFMTADWYHLPYDLIAKISNRIVNEVKGINRVCYDVTSKPPGTIEWE